MELVAHVKEVNSVPVIGLSGEMDVRTAGRLWDPVLLLLNKGADKIVINLDNVQYVDSSGLGTMVGVLKRMTEQNCKLCVVSSNPLINKVLEITGLGSIFNIKANDTDAISCFDTITFPSWEAGTAASGR